MATLPRIGRVSKRYWRRTTGQDVGDGDGFVNIVMHPYDAEGVRVICNRCGHKIDYASAGFERRENTSVLMPVCDACMRGETDGR